MRKPKSISLCWNAESGMKMISTFDSCESLRKRLYELSGLLLPTGDEQTERKTIQSCLNIIDLIETVEKDRICKRDDIVALYPDLDECLAYETFNEALRSITGERYNVSMKTDDHFYYDIIKGSKK